jgi:phospholipid/cholesterol/gamma-HCH transport system substrate-binding protein
MAAPATSRILAVACLVPAVVVAAIVLLGGGEGSYNIAARFIDAGQLVKGDLVEVGGRRVGTVSELRLTDDGMADVILSIDDDAIKPLHEGTTAAIRTVGLASVTNRVVELLPGPEDTAAIPDDGVLPPSRTRGVVDLDMLLDAVDPRVRKDLQTVVHQAADAFAAPGPEQVNRGLEYFHPALSQTRLLGAEIVRDQGALERLVKTGAGATGALASRDEDLAAGLDSTAAALRQLASERDSLADLIERAPATLRQTNDVLGRLTRALPVVDPLLAGLRPAVAPLARVLRQTPTIAANAEPAIAQIRALLPQATKVLRGVPALDKAATPSLASTTTALRELLPIVAGLRTYSPDFIAGLFNGFGGSAGGYYDANGHFLRISLEGAPSSLPGVLPTPSFSFPSNGYRTGIDARCPGAAEEPVPDGSNPWVPDASLCDPADNMVTP